MRFKQPFLKLPIRFDAEVLAAEVRSLPESAWIAHPMKFVGNEAVRLVSAEGEATDDLDGPMRATEHLDDCPYIQQIMAEIGAVWGRSRLMGLAAGSEVPPHIDVHYYWRTHLRIHIPVITNPGVEFTCGDQTVHMAAGDCWIFDSFRLHDVQNRGNEQRIHLVLDTVGGGRLPELIAAADAGTEPHLVPPAGTSDKSLRFERINAPTIMSPWEIRCHVAFLLDQASPDPLLPAVTARMETFIDSWAAAWAQFGPDNEGRLTYSQLLQEVEDDLRELGGADLLLRNRARLYEALERIIFKMALGKPSLAPTAATRSSYRDRFDRPIFIVSSPRSGSTILFDTIQQAPELHSTKNESHFLIEDIPGLSPADHNWSSNVLEASDATPERTELLAEAFYSHLRDRDGGRPEGRVRFVEKTPKNALRVPFFRAAWPDAHFIYLYRDPRETLHSMMEAWHSGRFRTYPRLPQWQGPAWSLLLVPGWERLNGMQLPEIVAHQWTIVTDRLLDELEQLERDRVHVVDYGAFIASPQSEVARLAGEAGLGWDRQVAQTLPFSKTTLSRPAKDKWRRIQPVIEAVWPIVEQADKRAKAFVEERLRRDAAA